MGIQHQLYLLVISFGIFIFIMDRTKAIVIGVVGVIVIAVAIVCGFWLFDSNTNVDVDGANATEIATTGAPDSASLNVTETEIPDANATELVTELPDVNATVTIINDLNTEAAATTAEPNDVTDDADAS